MSELPSPQTPLYHHPLPALENWLVQLGASRQRPHISLVSPTESGQEHLRIGRASQIRPISFDSRHAFSVNAGDVPCFEQQLGLESNLQ